MHFFLFWTLYTVDTCMYSKPVIHHKKMPVVAFLAVTLMSESLSPTIIYKSNKIINRSQKNKQALTEKRQYGTLQLYRTGRKGHGQSLYFCCSFKAFGIYITRWILNISALISRCIHATIIWIVNDISYTFSNNAIDSFNESIPVMHF